MSDDWVTVKTCRWMHEALFFGSVLDGAGIEAEIPNEHTLNLQPFYATLDGGVRVLVRASDAERARELLESAAVPPPADPGEPDRS